MYSEHARVFNGKDVFSVSGHTPTNPAYVRQNFGIHLDTGHTKYILMRGYHQDVTQKSLY